MRSFRVCPQRAQSGADFRDGRRWVRYERHYADEELADRLRIRRV